MSNYPEYIIGVIYKKQDDGTYLVDINYPGGTHKNVPPQTAERTVKAIQARAIYLGHNVLIATSDDNLPEQLNG